jgi:hypothetical protein
MGLAERRIAAAYEKEQFPKWKKKISAVVGFELAFDVSFEPLVKEGFLESYPDTLDHNFFTPLERALRSICADEMGKEAFAAKFKKVRITSDRSWHSLEITTEGDVIKLDADPSYSRDEGAVGDHTKRITEALEKAL